MDTLSFEMAAPSVWRRFWPELVLLLALGLLAIALGLGEYIDDDLVLIGSMNAYVIVGGLVIGAIWCVAMFVIFRLWKLVSGRVAEALSIVAGGVVVLAAMWFSAIVALFTLLGTDQGPYRVLDVPGSTTSFVVTTLHAR